MIVHCPICSEILLPSDVLYSTPCGHIFHDACLSRWISNNTTCPQCRQECSSSTNHRIYLPEVNFQDQDSLVERMNEINRQKLEFEGKLKKIEDEKKGLELQLKKKKQEFHRVLQRQMKRSKSTSNIPSRHHKSSTASVTVGNQSQPHSSKNLSSQSSPAQRKMKRNASRVRRSKLYFERKRLERQNNNNNPSVEVDIEMINEVESIPDSSDSPLAISVSSEDTISSN